MDETFALQMKEKIKPFKKKEHAKKMEDDKNKLEKEKQERDKANCRIDEEAEGERNGKKKAKRNERDGTQNA